MATTSVGAQSPRNAVGAGLPRPLKTRAGRRISIAHITVVTPHRAGLYETTRDLVAAERAAGIDARIVDPVNPLHPRGLIDRDVPIADHHFALQADVICNHSGLGEHLHNIDKPIIHFLHGRPHSSFLLEQASKIAVLTYLTKIRTDPRYKLFVTFWPEFLPYWSVILPREKLHAITAPVDLDLWTPNGPKGYNFHGHKADVNVVCASMWREDESPFHVINAFHLYANRQPKDTSVHSAGAHASVKLHIYAAPQKGAAWQVLRSALDDNGMLGECVGPVTGLDNVYRAADCAITPHRIPTRSVREALACGCNVVMAPNTKHYTPYTADPQALSYYASQIKHAARKPDPAYNRRIATQAFNPAKSAAQLIDLVQEVLHGNN